MPGKQAEKEYYESKRTQGWGRPNEVQHGCVTEEAFITGAGEQGSPMAEVGYTRWGRISKRRQEVAAGKKGRGNLPGKCRGILGRPENMKTVGTICDHLNQVKGSLREST